MGGEVLGDNGCSEGELDDVDGNGEMQILPVPEMVRCAILKLASSGLDPDSAGATMSSSPSWSLQTKRSPSVVRAPRTPV